MVLDPDIKTTEIPWGTELLDEDPCSRGEFWRRLSFLHPDFVGDAARIVRWMEQEFGLDGVAYAGRGDYAEHDFVEGDLFVVIVAEPTIVVQLDVHMYYIIVESPAGCSEAGDWLDDRVGVALASLKTAIVRSKNITAS